MRKSIQHAARLTRTLVLLLPLAAFPAASDAQALPAAEASPISTGFALPSSAGSLRYAVSASESLSSNSFGSQGTDSSTNFTGDLAFITSSLRDPFSMVFSGGHSLATSYQTSYTFLNLSLTQAASAGRWTLLLSDSVSYLPATASSGLSGVPGVGDLGVNPTQTGISPTPVGVTPMPTSESSAQGVLTGFSTQVNNSSSLSVQRQFTGKSSLLATGSYSLMRFLNDTGGTATSSNPGLDSDSDGASLGLNHRIDERNSLGGNYAYSHDTYSGLNFGVPRPATTSQTASLTGTHQFTRKLSASMAAGPQWTSTASPGDTPSLSLFVNLSGRYAGKFSRASLAYTRATNSGYGVVGGSISSSISFSASRTLNQVWLCAATAAYTQTSELPSSAALALNVHTTVEGVQLTRSIGRSFSAFASYTVQDQTNQGAQAAVDLFSGISQVEGFGLTYSPTAIRIGHP